MGYKVYSNEFKAQVVEFYKTHKLNETTKEFGVSHFSIVNWCKQLGFLKGYPNFEIDFKHEVCQYYDNNTLEQACAKYDVSRNSVLKWRRQLGYRNKSRGYNLYMEGLQPTVQKRERRDFIMTKMENGDLKGRIAVLEDKLKDVTYLLEQAVKDLNGKGLI